VESAQQASDLVERGDYDGAITILRDLLSTDISEVDKAMMCLNIAVVYDKMGRTDDALASFAAGIDYERRHGRFYVTEQRAAFLAKQGRDRESLAEYQELLGRPELTENDRERIRQNVEVLRRRVT
jgi:hypothetical protein